MDELRTLFITKNKSNSGVNPLKIEVHPYETKINQTLQRIEQRVSETNLQLIRKYDRQLVHESLAHATRLKNLETVLNLTTILNKDWNQVDTDDIKELVYNIVTQYSNNGQETHTTYDHKKILKIFFRWVKLGSSPKMYLSINPNTYHETKTNFTFTIKKEIKPLDTNPPKLLAPNDIIVQSKNSVGEKVSFEIQSIDDVDTKIFPSCNPQSGAFFPIGKTVVKCNAMDSSGNRAEQVTFSIIVESTKTSVPEWVKNNAKWWSDGQVDDSTFSQGIGFLIKEKVISVSSLPPRASAVAQEKVPDWIKNNAKWWADGMISEDDFLKGITYMVEKGIIRAQ
jgi:hypothetical protein